MTHDPDQHASLGAMYSDYFLDYASYVILERAVPHLYDGLKPVQRRILHAMDELDDGRYNKVAGIVGNTMNYHPHGDQSIGAAIVGLGQKELLIDTQGNWGNTLTGDGAAAPRYIEARLTKFALDVVFNPKTTKWLPSYDGRRKEPDTLPVKFPLLLAQGVEGIAVGLACKVLPHNFNELIEASIAVLRDEPFTLLPDFPTGGILDAADYKDGLRGGKVRIRARISIDKKALLRITEIPFGTTTGALMDSIVQAADKGKIKIAKIEDNTAEFADILVYLPAAARPESAAEPAAPGMQTVLVVDDEAAVRDFIGTVLQREGYRVLLANDGKNALAVCEAEGGAIDAAVVDVVMPLMGADDLLPALKAQYPEMKFLLTSGYSQAEARGLCEAFPGSTFIQKPYTSRQIAAAVEDLLAAMRRGKTRSTAT